MSIRIWLLLLALLSGCADASIPKPPPPPVQGEQQPPDEAEAEQSDLQNPLARSLGQFLNNSVGEEAGLGEMLTEADSLLSEIKDENRTALQELKRQVRLNGPRPPNLVMIVLDDVGYGELGCYGHPTNQTPHLDGIAATGARFTDFYAGAANDSGTWWCLMTGWDTSRATRAGTASFVLQPQVVTLPEVMWQAGYKTAFLGSWGLGADEQNLPHLHGFDPWFGALANDQRPDASLDQLWSNGTRVRLVDAPQPPSRRYVQDLFMSEALAYLARQTADEPFLLVVSLLLPVEAATANQAADRQTRGIALTHLDQDVGRIVEQLRQRQLANNTIVACFSDSGAPLADDRTRDDALNGPLRGGKGDLYEGGIRVPLLVRWPGKVSAGQVISEPSAVWDLLPTWAEAAGALKRPRSLDGISLLAALRGEPSAPRKLLYWETRNGGLAQAVRSGSWKIVRQAGREQLEDVELYNLYDDPGETKDVAKDFPEIVAQFIR